MSELVSSFEAEKTYHSTSRTSTKKPIDDYSRTITTFSYIIKYHSQKTVAPFQIPTRVLSKQS